MSYTPTEWKTGDVITAEKLNNMESGIVNAGASLVKILDKIDLTLDNNDKRQVQIYGTYVDGKKFSDLTQGKTLIGVWSIVLIDGSYYQPTSTKAGLPLDNPNYYNGTTATSVTIYYPDYIFSGGAESAFGKIDVYAICI